MLDSPHMTPHTTIDLFAGCGGLTQGFKDAGYETLAAVENWADAANSYTLNHPDTPLHVHNIGDVQGTIRALTPHIPDTGVDVVTGGPPCQDYSSAGRRTNTGRADLTGAFVNVAVALNPRIIVMENVPPAKNYPTYQAAVDTLRAHGYGVHLRVLHANQYGVPQTRKRLFCVAAHGMDENTIANTLDMPGQNELTVRDVLGVLDGGFEHYYVHPRSYARRGVYSIDAPAPTMRGQNRPVPPTYRGHPKDSAPVGEARSLTVGERALIQTFPAGYRFSGSVTSVNQQIGNAVPPRLAEVVALSCRALLGRVREGGVL